jgi:hypothetical protein
MSGRVVAGAVVAAGVILLGGPGGIRDSMLPIDDTDQWRIVEVSPVQDGRGDPITGYDVTCGMPGEPYSFRFVALPADAVSAALNQEVDDFDLQGDELTPLPCPAEVTR